MNVYVRKNVVSLILTIYICQKENKKKKKKNALDSKFKQMASHKELELMSVKFIKLLGTEISVSKTDNKINEP